MLSVARYFDDIVKSAIKSVYNDINEGTENFRKSFDLLHTIRRRYFSRLDTTLSRVQIWGMNSPIRLSNIYIPTRLSKRVARSFFVDLDLARSISDVKMLVRQTEIPPKEFLSENNSILIVGGAGAGKTTFLTALILGYAGLCEKAQSYFDEHLFPVWVPLRSFPSPPDSMKKLVLDIVVGELEDADDIWPFLKRVLLSGKAIIVFDGLDEIPGEKQVYWRDFILKFRKNYPECKVVASCRSGGLYVEFPGFTHAEVLPFNKDDVHKFVTSWFSADKMELTTKLQSALELSTRVSDLTGSPLLLSLLCILFEHDLELPRHRVDLFSRCIEAMLVKWDTSRGFRRDSAFSQLSLTKRRRIFQRVAAEFSNRECTVMPETSVIPVVANYIQKFDMEAGVASDVLGELEAHHGLLIKPAANVFAFSHLSFQDFFTAEFVVATHQEREFLRKYATKPRTRDIIVFCACLVEDSEVLVQDMLGLSDLRGRQNYPAIAQRLAVASLLVNTLAGGASMSPRLRHQLVNRIVEYFKYATNHFQGTGLNLHCTFYNSEPKIRHTFFNRRPTAFDALLALETLVQEVIASNYSPLFSQIKETLAESMNYSCRAVLSSVFIKKEPNIVLQNYEQLLQIKSELPAKFGESIARVTNELRNQIET